MKLLEPKDYIDFFCDQWNENSLNTEILLYKDGGKVNIREYVPGVLYFSKSDELLAHIFDKVKCCNDSNACLTDVQTAVYLLDAIYHTQLNNPLPIANKICNYLNNVDVTGVEFSGCELDEENFEGAIGFHPHMRCPEEGSFIAWKKCRDNRIVKLLIPETAKRTGAPTHSCRASEAVVLTIWDQENAPCEFILPRYVPLSVKQHEGVACQMQALFYVV